MGEIRHEWDGTILTIYSDSGVSSVDLKGPQGNTGCRGPQGPAGVIVDSLGNITWPGYATEEYVNHLVENVNVDLTGYATEAFVRAKIATAQLEGAEVDLSDFALKSEVQTMINEALGVIENGSY